VSANYRLSVNEELTLLSHCVCDASVNGCRPRPRSCPRQQIMNIQTLCAYTNFRHQALSRNSPTARASPLPRALPSVHARRPAYAHTGRRQQHQQGEKTPMAFEHCSRIGVSPAAAAVCLLRLCQPRALSLPEGLSGFGLPFRHLTYGRAARRSLSSSEPHGSHAPRAPLAAIPFHVPFLIHVAIRRALECPEQDSGVLFVLKGRGPRAARPCVSSLRTFDSTAPRAECCPGW
jgi:hypothetical protein